MELQLVIAYMLVWYGWHVGERRDEQLGTGAATKTFDYKDKEFIFYLKILKT